MLTTMNEISKNADIKLNKITKDSEEYWINFVNNGGKKPKNWEKYFKNEVSLPQNSPIIPTTSKGDTKKKELKKETSIENYKTNIQKTNTKNDKKKKTTIDVVTPDTNDTSIGNSGVVSLVSKDTNMSLVSLVSEELYNKLDNKYKILFILFNNKNITIKRIEEITKININTIKNNISRQDREMSLISQELIELTEQNPNKYSITDKGKKIIKNILKQEELKRLEEQAKEEYKSDLQTKLLILKEFLNKKYLKVLLERKQKGKKWMVIDFKEILKYNPDIADELLDKTYESLKLFELAVSQIIDIHKFSVRINNLPNHSSIKIGDIRSQDLNKICSIDCIIKQTSTVKPKANIMRFECPSCGNIIPIIQVSDHLLEPTRCGCGRKGKFTVLSTEFKDFQVLKVEELPEQLDGRTNTTSINILMFDELTDKKMQSYYNPGSRIKVNGIPLQTEAFIRNGKKSSTFNIVIDANFIEPQEKIMKFKISEEEKEKLKAISLKENLHELLTNSYAPEIKKLHEEKLTVMLSLLGGNIDKRNEIHVLFAGDPGLAKSELLQFANKHIPFVRYASGTSSSSVGLTAGVVKDEISGGWSLEAGAVVMANNGCVCVDELDKLPFEQQNDLNECMEQQTVTINKAGVHGTLNAKTTLICASNPKGHRFYKDEDYVKQINLPHALFTRFDLVWVMTQTKTQKLDLLKELTEGKEVEIIPKDDLIYYLFYARTLKPSFSQKMKELVSNKLAGLIEAEDAVSLQLPISITPRQMFGLQRLTTAFAKLRLSNKVEECDIENAWNLFCSTLKRMGFGA